jgi:hypothetical protein
MAKCIYFHSILPAFQEEEPGFMSRQIFEGMLLLLDNVTLRMLLSVQFELMVTSSYRVKCLSVNL